MHRKTALRRYCLCLLLAAGGAAAAVSESAVPAPAVATNAKDSVVFDMGDYGGPSTGDLGVLASDTAVLLLFRGDQPVALRVGSDGAVSVVGT